MPNHFLAQTAAQTQAEAGPPQFTGVSFLTSSQSMPIPLMWGTRRLAPNMIWQCSLIDLGQAQTAPVGGNTTLVFGSPTVTFTTSVTLTAGQLLIFSAQPGVIYTVASPSSGTTATLTLNYSGTNSTTSTTTLINLQPPTGDVILDGPAVGGPGWTFHTSILPFNWTRDLSNSEPRGMLSIRSRLATSGLQVSDPDPNNTLCHWHVPTIFALCQGPVNTIIRMWNQGGTQPVPWTNTPSFAAPGQWWYALTPPAWFYTLFNGSTSQGVWPFFVQANAQTGGPYYPGSELVLAYRNIAYIASPVVDCGHTDTGLPGQTPRQEFDVVRIPNAGYAKSYAPVTGASDYSFADIIPDLLTNALYGMGLQSGDIDATSLLTFKQYQFAQGLYFSPLLDSQTAGTDILDRFAMESNSWIYFDGTVIRFAPLGDETLTANGQTYTPDPTPAYNLGFGDFLDTLQVDRADAIDCYNRVRIEIKDRFNSYATTPIEWKDETLIAQFGIRDASNVSCDDVCDDAVGAKVVELYGKRLAYLRNTYTFTLSYRYILLLPGSIVTLTDPNWGLNLFPVRVRTVQEDGAGKLTIVAEEFPGTIGISRARAIQPWIQGVGGSGGAAGGGGSSSGGSGSTVPPPIGPVSGPVTTGPTDFFTLIQAVAGGYTITLGAIVAGPIYHWKHVGGAAGSNLFETTGQAVTLSRGTNTFTIEDPQNTFTIGNTALFQTSQVTYDYWLDSVHNVFRCLRQVR